LDLRAPRNLGLLEITFAFLFVDLFDNVGTLVGVLSKPALSKTGKIREWAAAPARRMPSEPSSAR